MEVYTVPHGICFPLQKLLINPACSTQMCPRWILGGWHWHLYLHKYPPFYTSVSSVFALTHTRAGVCIYLFLYSQIQWWAINTWVNIPQNMEGYISGKKSVSFKKQQNISKILITFYSLGMLEGLVMRYKMQ